MGLGCWKGGEQDTRPLFSDLGPRGGPAPPSPAQPSLCVRPSVRPPCCVVCSVQCDVNPCPGACAVPCVCCVARVSVRNPECIVAKGPHGQPPPPAQQRPSRSELGPGSGHRAGGLGGAGWHFSVARVLLALTGPLPRPGAPLRGRAPPFQEASGGSIEPSWLPAGVPHLAPSQSPPRTHFEVTEPKGRQDVQAPRPPVLRGPAPRAPAVVATSPSATLDTVQVQIMSRDRRSDMPPPAAGACLLQPWGQWRLVGVEHKSVRHEAGSPAGFWYTLRTALHSSGGLKTGGRVTSRSFCLAEFMVLGLLCFPVLSDLVTPVH